MLQILAKSNYFAEIQECSRDRPAKENLEKKIKTNGFQHLHVSKTKKKKTI